MTSEQEAQQEMLAYVYGERGYIVMGCTRQQVIGSIRRDVETIEGVPLRIVSETDRADFEEQRRLRGVSLEGSRASFYYRCESD